MTSPRTDPEIQDDDRRAWAARPVGGGPEWTAWSWSGGRRSFSWLGVFLVLVGAALLVRYVQPAISFNTLLLLALGLAFGAAWLLGGARWALVPAAVVLALAAARLAAELHLIEGDGWSALFLGVALLVTWVIGELWGSKRRWAFWAGAILALIGLAQVTDRIAGLPDLGWLWPAAIIAIGAALLVQARLRGDGQPS
jgi:hypothetical protein